MKIFNLHGLAEESEGEYVLGLKDLHTHAVYIVYGFLAPGETGRKVLPGKGHEEILCAVKGEVRVKTPGETFTLKSGEAVHVKEEDEWTLENTGDETVFYILAGGHPPKEH
ncbi:MAG TPA: cupin domain-containing protein [Euryarchaeota archaeon]|nr:cupin domain-containing protein [Euryarchaeota archaeon]